jgi:hypothetical protein
MSAQLNNPPAMLVLGDSVEWGQGLQEWNKFSSLVRDQLKYRPEYEGLTCTALAHSGAIIGVGVGPQWRNVPPEVPWHLPTIIQQCDGYSGNPDDVRVVLLDGGINDVSVDVIINPETTQSDLSAKVERYCHSDMATLLRKVAGKFSSPQCRIIVTGYYQILSEASRYAPTVSFLELWGISAASSLISTAGGFSNLIALSKLFWTESNAALARAVDEVYADCGNRITFVRSGFTPNNSLFQEGSLLWQFKGTPPFIDAADDFADFRAQVCSNHYADGTVGCATCRFASVGHPTADGAQKYCEQIMEVFA